MRAIRYIAVNVFSDLRDLDSHVMGLVQTGPDSNVNPAVAIRGISSDSSTSTACGDTITLTGCGLRSCSTRG